MTREWLEADGQGGFAMGAADGIRTRRYHALLCAALAPPDDRRVLVADLDAWLETAAGRFALSSHRYRGGAGGDVVDPKMTAAFAHAPWPRWEWTFGDVRIACELVVEPGAASARAIRRAGPRWRATSSSAPP